MNPAMTVEQEKRTVRISSKRQITIPQKFFSLLGFGSEAECFVQNGQLVIRPVKPSVGGEFAEQILADLIHEGYNGTELLEEFKTRQAKVRPAVEQLIAESEAAAAGEGAYSTYDDIFGSEDN